MDFGIDRLPSLTSLVEDLRKARVALLANPASVNRTLTHTADVLRGLGIVPRVMFGPEHGWTGQVEAAVGSEESQSVLGRARVVSLYGDRYEDLSPRQADLEPIDTVIIDLQDVGARYYTFVWTSVLVARACKSMGIRVVVLDRPNVLGDTVEGRLQDPKLLSFVGLERIPIRHGLTLGQIVAWRAKVEGYGKLVKVVAATGIDASAHATSWDRPFLMPSPNIDSYETALAYAGGCLLEGTNLSDGRGTPRPFEITGAPWLDGDRLARELERIGLPGFAVRSTTFRPTFHKHMGQVCRGVQIQVTEPQTFRPVATYVALVALAHRAHPADLVFRTERFEFVDDIPAFDLLSGSAVARERILAGDDALEIADYVAAVGPEERQVVDEARKSGRL